MAEMDTSDSSDSKTSMNVDVSTTESDSESDSDVSLYSEEDCEPKATRHYNQIISDESEFSKFIPIDYMYHDTSLTNKFLIHRSRSLIGSQARSEYWDGILHESGILSIFFCTRCKPGSSEPYPKSNYPAEFKKGDPVQRCLIPMDSFSKDDYELYFLEYGESGHPNSNRVQIHIVMLHRNAPENVKNKCKQHLHHLKKIDRNNALFYYDSRTKQWNIATHVRFLDRVVEATVNIVFLTPQYMLPEGSRWTKVKRE